MNYPTIAIIGAGNMGSSLIGGLIKHGHPVDKIIASDPSEEKLSQLRSKFGVSGYTDNKPAVEKAEVVVLAVKPQIMAKTVLLLSSILQKRRPLLISIAAGVPAESIDQWAGGSLAVVRCMPNTPSLLGVGATGLYANSKVTPEQNQIAETIMRAVGITIWVKNQHQLDVVTALSGSGPAYFFMVMEALEEVGIEFGLPVEDANALVTQTALGAAMMAIENKMDLKELRKQVTSPGGTTEKAINTLEENNLRYILKKAVTAAKLRSEELALIFGEK